MTKNGKSTEMRDRSAPKVILDGVGGHSRRDATRAAVNDRSQEKSNQDPARPQVGDKKFGSVILASALFAWGCGSPGSGGTAGTTVGRPVRAAPPGAPDPIPRAPAALDPGTGGTSTRARAATRRGHRRHAGTAAAAPRRDTAGTARPRAARGGTTGGTGGAGGSGAAGRGGTTGTGGRGGSGTAAGTGHRHRGHGRHRYGRLGHGRDGEPRCDAPDDRGVRLQHRLEQCDPQLGHVLQPTGNGLGLSIVRVAMQSNGSLSGAVPPASYNVKVIGSPWTAPATARTTTTPRRVGTC